MMTLKSALLAATLCLAPMSALAQTAPPAAYAPPPQQAQPQPQQPWGSQPTYREPPRHRDDRYGDERWRDERAYRVAYGDRHPDHSGHYEDEPDRRSFWERAGDRVASWLGEGDHRGRGPSGYKRTDTRISEEAHERLTDDPWLDASAITVTVEGGEVTLSGQVLEREAKHRAERLIEDMAGVTHVQNNLRVRRNDPITGSETGFGDAANAEQMRAAGRKN